MTEQARINCLYFLCANLSYNIEDLFHLFGDPALPLPFPKESSIIDNPISELPIGEYTSLNVGPYNANLNIFDKEKVILKGYETGDTVVYHNPGNSIYAGSFYESTCFITSLDAYECDSCASAYIQINHDCLSYNKFQNICSQFYNCIRRHINLFTIILSLLYKCSPSIENNKFTKKFI